MPLYEKKSFKRIKPPSDLSADEKLFYCKITNEVFREYEEFFDRVILCNSLVWTCAITGRSGLTYQEALESESNARSTLDKFPRTLKKPVLFLATLTSRGRLNDLCDDIFLFVKNRYFAGEKVEVTVNGIKKNCEVTKVISPDSNSKSPNSKQDGKAKTIRNVNPDKLKYEVKQKETGKTLTVKSQCISRSKGSYTRANSKLFLKHNTVSENGVFKVKDSAVQKNGLNTFHFSDSFMGPLPKYANSPTKTKKSVGGAGPSSGTPDVLKDKKRKATPSATPEHSGKKTLQGKLDFKKESEVDKKKSRERDQEEFEKKRLLLEEERQKKKEELKKRLEEEKEKVKEQKIKERERKKEEKKKMTEYLNSWKKPRDDLECDDLKDLPKPTPVECSIPMECFGDAVMVLEFLNAFGDLINLKDSFPQGFTFEHLEKSLLETDIQGCLNDLFQLLLTSIFQMQDTEPDKSIDSSTDGSEKDVKTDLNMTADQAVELANAAYSWPQLYHGVSLQSMNLDSFCLTEVLRLHILASGCDKDHSFGQGLTGISEDPGLLFKVEEAELLNKLANATIFEMSCEERLKILSLLTSQLSSYEAFTSAIEDNLAKARPLKMELKQLKWAFSRQMRIESLNKIKKKPDDKANKSVDGEGTESLNNTKEEENLENLTPEQRQEFEEKKKKDEAKRKADFQRREKELKAQIDQLQSSYQVAPLGRDRAFRRFWVFRSLPGLFVEDDDKSIGTCLPKETPQVQNIPNIPKCPLPDGAVNIKKYLQQMNEPKNCSSDKENDILQDLAIIQSDLAMPNKNRKLSDLNSRTDMKNASSDRDVSSCYQCREKYGDFPGNGPKFCTHSKPPSVFGMCTASIFTCPVHNLNAPRTKWSFFYKEEDLDVLLNALNVRGFREGALKEVLVSESEFVRELLSKCLYNQLNKTLPLAPQPEVRKSQRHQQARKSAFANVKPQDAMELTFRDMILEFEQRIYAGGLGSIKVQDRILWREAIQQRAYDRQCDQQAWITRFPFLDTVKQEDSVKVDPVVCDLAYALLQISDGIEGKFLHPPLGESDAFKLMKEKSLRNVASWEARQNAKEADDEKESSPCPVVPKTPLSRWQESVLKCGSFSQLFMYLNTLERSVAWSRSVLKAHCKICRRRGDGENMLLCDGCNRGHHLYCLKPPLVEVPQGDWFCTGCKPPEKPVTPQKRGRRAASDSDDENDDSVEEEESDDDSDEEDEEDEDAESGAEQPTEMLIEVCEVCEGPGTVICCDGCPKVYHPECIGMKRIPRGEWLCPKCQKKDEAAKRSQRHGLNGNYDTRAHSVTTDKQPSKKRNSLPKIQIRAAKRKLDEGSDSEFVPAAKKARSDSASSSSMARRRSETSDKDVLDYKTCLDVLDVLMHHSSGWPFLAPVSKKDAPDYHRVIKRPMDFGTIRSKLNNIKYRTNEDFILDLCLIFQNCEVFNPKDSPEFKAGQIMSSECKKLLTKHNLLSPSFLNKHKNLFRK